MWSTRNCGSEQKRTLALTKLKPLAVAGWWGGVVAGDQTANNQEWGWAQRGVGEPGDVR